MFGSFLLGLRTYQHPDNADVIQREKLYTFLYRDRKLYTFLYRDRKLYTFLYRDRKLYTFLYRDRKLYTFLYRDRKFDIDLVLVTFSFEFLTFEDGTDKLLRNVGKEHPRRLQILCVSRGGGGGRGECNHEWNRMPKLTFYYFSGFQRDPGGQKYQVY